MNLIETNLVILSEISEKKFFFLSPLLVRTNKLNCLHEIRIIKFRDFSGEMKERTYGNSNIIISY